MGQQIVEVRQLFELEMKNVSWPDSADKGKLFWIVESYKHVICNNSFVVNDGNFCGLIGREGYIWKKPNSTFSEFFYESFYQYR